MAYNVYPAPLAGVEKKAFVFENGEVKSSAITLESGTYNVINSSSEYTIDLNGKKTSGSIAGVYLTSSATSIVTTLSNPLANWTQVSQSFTTVLRTVVYGNGIYLAAGNGGKVFKSITGNNWTDISGGSIPVAVYNCSTYANGIYLLGGSGGTFITSTDSITWTSIATFSSSAVNDIEYLNGLFVAVGAGGNLRTSTDGVTWTTRTSGFGTSIITAVTYGNGLYVAVGAAGKISTSTDGTTWTSRSSTTTQTLLGVAYANGIYVALTDTTSVYATSTDAITWTSRAATAILDTNGEGFKVYNNTFFASRRNQNEIFYSTDGLTWKANTVLSNNIPQSFVLNTDDGTVITVGSSSAIAVSSLPIFDYIVTFEKLNDSDVTVVS
jgi:hypothetical protein